VFKSSRPRRAQFETTDIADEETKWSAIIKQAGATAR
jgi:hypothetical protein